MGYNNEFTNTNDINDDIDICIKKIDEFINNRESYSLMAREFIDSSNRIKNFCYVIRICDEYIQADYNHLADYLSELKIYLQNQKDN